MAQRCESGSPVVGLSANVLDSRLTGGRLDGIGIYTLALERALAALGVATRRVGAPVLRNFSVLRPTDSAVCFGAPLAMSMAATALARIHALLSGGVERAIDLYHATDYYVPRLLRTPVVATLYDAIPLAHPEWGSRRLRRTKNRLLVASAANADLVIAISHAAAAEVAEHYRITPERIRVIPLGVDEEWFAPPPPDALQRIMRERALRGDHFLFVGTLQPRKNVGALLAAYDALPAHLRAAHQLIVAGSYGWGAEEVKAELLARRSRDDVKWLDYVTREELRALFATARAFVFPTLAEGFGLPVLEAFAAGAPVIASDLPALRELAQERAVFVPAGDIDSLASAMQAASDALPDATKIASARAWARRFDWRSTAEATLRVYDEALAAARSVAV